MEMFNDIYNKVRVFANNNGGRAPTHLRLNTSHLQQIKTSKHFNKFVNAQEYLDPDKPNRICGLEQVIDDRVINMEVY